MKRFSIISGSAILVAVTLIVGVAAAKFVAMTDNSYYLWKEQEVGRFAYAGSVREALEASPCISNAELREELIASIEAASVPSQTYLAAVTKAKLPEAEEKRLMQVANRRGFLLLYHLEEAKVPKEILDQFDLRKTYEIEPIKDRDLCACMPFSAGGIHKMHNVKYEGGPQPALEFKTKRGRVRLVPKCNNLCFEPLALTQVYIPPDRPTIGEKLAKEEARALPKAPTLLQYALQVNFFADRTDGFWRKKYEDAKTEREKVLAQGGADTWKLAPYYRIFTSAPFGEMLAERKSRPLSGRFLVRFLKKEPATGIQSRHSGAERVGLNLEYFRKMQHSPEDNVLTSQWVTTGERGWVIVPITFALLQFEVVLIQPEQLGEVLESVIVVRRSEFAAQSNPIHVWEVR